MGGKIGQMKARLHRNARIQILTGIVVLLGCAAAAPRAEIIEQILVKVNGEILTKTDLEQRQTALLRQRNQPFELASISDAELRKKLDEITPQILVDSVDEMLLVQRARELGYSMSDDQFTSVLENIKKENKFENDEEFQAALKQEGMTLPDLRKALERQMLVSRVQQAEVVNKIQVTEEEQKQYYDEHPDEFASVPSITLREILIAVPSDGKTVNVGLDEEAKQKADAVRARLVAGESFEKVAGEVSDAQSKASGGLIGPLNREDLTEELQKLLDSMKVGEISPVLRVPPGYEILKVEASVQGTRLEFEQARPQVTEKLFEAKRRVELEEYLKKLRAQAIIEWKNDDIRRAYEQGLTS